MTRIAWTVTWGLALLLAAMWIFSAVAPRRYSGQALNLFGPEYLDVSARRANRFYIAEGIEVLIVFATIGLLQRKSLVPKLFAGSVDGSRVVALGAVLYALIACILAAATFPAEFFKSYYLEKQFGLLRMSFGAWFGDYVKSTALNVMVGLVAGGGIAWTLLRFGRAWPYAAVLGFFGFSVLVSAIYPQFIAPMFNRFYPVQDQVIREDIRLLAEKAGLEVKNVLVMDASLKTSRANAYFAGIGNTRQVVLYDNLLKGYSREEIRLVVAHELGHWRGNHVVLTIILTSLAALIVLASFNVLVFPADVQVALQQGHLNYRRIESTLVSLLVFVTLWSYILTPASSFVSRSLEAQADRYSILLTGEPSTFVAAQLRLARDNLSDVEPPWFIRWFSWTHPTTMERLESARSATK